MNSKYVLTDESIIFNSVTLYRIKAIKSFYTVRVGDLGGFVEGYDNLSQDGNAWVYGNARVYGNAWIHGNARISGYAWIHGDARVSGNAHASGNAWIHGDARVYGNARVYSNARVYGNAWIHGNARISGYAWIHGDARVSSASDIISISPIGSENGVLTCYTTKSGIDCSRGCFSGTIEEFKKAVDGTHKNTIFYEEYMAAINLIEIKLNKENMKNDNSNIK